MIRKLPIPHFSRRHREIDAVVIHYISAIYSNPEKPYSVESIHQILLDYKVSYHYLVARNGDIYSLVPETKKAWHAGRSSLNGQQRVNDRSIGIAFINKPNDEYTHDALLSAVQIIKGARLHYPIPLNRIQGHDHIAPRRKKDPGEKFPWIKFLDDIAKGI